MKDDTSKKQKPTFDKNENELNEKIYTLELSHAALRSLREWLPKNYDNDDGTKEEIEDAIDTAVQN